MPLELRLRPNPWALVKSEALTCDLSFANPVFNCILASGYLVSSVARTRDDRIGGYVATAIVFSGITALWAWIVRDDPYYSMTNLLGLKLPLATVFYVTVMPALGFVAGRWRYQADGAAGAGAWLAKVAARSLHFLYTHILIVLFTIAMAVDHFFGWNMDNAIRQIDDGIFDIAARFSPWVAAYLAGFNIGRVWAANESVPNHSTLPNTPAKNRLYDHDPEAMDDRLDRVKLEGQTPTAPPPASSHSPELDPATSKPRFSRLR